MKALLHQIYALGAIVLYAGCPAVSSFGIPSTFSRNGPTSCCLGTSSSQWRLRETLRLRSSSSKSETATSNEGAVESAEAAEAVDDLMAELNKLTEEFVYVQCECAIRNTNVMFNVFCVCNL